MLQYFSLTPHWSVLSALFYVLLGFIPVYVVSKFKDTNEPERYPIDLNASIWIVAWTIVAAYRYVDIGIGGADAYSYIKYYKMCSPEYVGGMDGHLTDDLGFHILNTIINFISSDYHLFFVLVYGFMTFTFVYFYKEFVPQKTNIVPYILTVYLFIRSFNTLRSNLAISFLLLALCFFIHKSYIKTTILVLISVSIHKMIIPFVLFIPFYLIGKRMTMKREYILILFILVSFMSTVLKAYILPYIFSLQFDGAYSSYVLRSDSWFDTWGIAFEQLLLGIFIFGYYNSINSYISKHNQVWQDKIKFIILLCVFDLIMIPFNGAFGIWRGYEVFYIPRIVMWGMILYIVTEIRYFTMRNCINFIVLCVLIGWLFFRFDRTWEDSKIMPYIFEPLMYI